MKTFFLLNIFFSSILVAKECDFKFPSKIFTPRHAKHFSIDYYSNFKIIHVDNKKYLLTNTTDLGCETTVPKILTPVKKVVLMSTTYLPSVQLLKEENSLMAFQGKKYIVSSAFKLDQIKEVPFKFNSEYLLGLKADLIMGYEANLTDINQQLTFDSLKIPVVMNKDLEEKTPLARAEWLIYISSFYNQEKKAMDIYDSIEKNYMDLKKRNLKYVVKPKIIVGEIQNGYWVTCGGDSDLGQLIADAGGDLQFKRATNKTQNISLEELGQKKMKLDVWLTHNMWASKQEMNDGFLKNQNYLLINTKNIFNNNLILNTNKSNDYWEMGLQRPDLLLLDLTAIFHPEDYKSFKFHWYRKI